MRTDTRALLSVLAIAVAPACSKSVPTGAVAALAMLAAPATNAAAAAPTSAAAGVPAAAPSAPAAPLATYDLSPAGPQWAGWTARAVAGCQVMEDLGHAARIACDGADGLDLRFQLSRRNLADVRHQLEIGASEGQARLNFTTSTADSLEWTHALGGSTSWNFVQNYVVDHRDVSCSNNIAWGLSSEDDVRQYRDACASLSHAGASSGHARTPGAHAAAPSVHPRAAARARVRAANPQRLQASPVYVPELAKPSTGPQSVRYGARTTRWLWVR